MANTAIQLRNMKAISGPTWRPPAQRAFRGILASLAAGDALPEPGQPWSGTALTHRRPAVVAALATAARPTLLQFNWTLHYTGWPAARSAAAGVLAGASPALQPVTPGGRAKLVHALAGATRSAAQAARGDDLFAPYRTPQAPIRPSSASQAISPGWQATRGPDARPVLAPTVPSRLRPATPTLPLDRPARAARAQPGTVTARVLRAPPAQPTASPAATFDRAPIRAIATPVELASAAPLVLRAPPAQTLGMQQAAKAVTAPSVGDMLFEQAIQQRAWPDFELRLLSAPTPSAEPLRFESASVDVKTPAPSPQAMEAPALGRADIAQLADKVEGLLRQRQRQERERRGGH